METDFEFREKPSPEQQAAWIVEHPELFKVCLICNSVIARKEPLCVNCKGYRFSEDHDFVADQAGMLVCRESRSISIDDLTE